MSEWRTVPGYEGRYEVSEAGGVRTLARPTVKAAQLNPQVDPAGYPRVRLYDGTGGRRWHRVHRLVASAFLGPAQGRLVRHLDSDVSNAALSNLAYGTQRENVADARAADHLWPRRVTHCKHGHEYTAANTIRWGKSQQRVCRACYDATRARRAEYLRLRRRGVRLPA